MVKKVPSKEYHPDEFRSHPFRCLGFPFIGSLIFIFFWFILTPLVFYCLYQLHKEAYNARRPWSRWWPYLYWITAFVTFLIILSVLVCFWRCCKKHSQNKLKDCPGYTIVLQKHNIPSDQTWDEGTVHENGKAPKNHEDFHTKAALNYQYKIVPQQPDGKLPDQHEPPPNGNRFISVHMPQSTGPTCPVVLPKTAAAQEEGSGVKMRRKLNPLILPKADATAAESGDVVEYVRQEQGTPRRSAFITTPVKMQACVDCEQFLVNERFALAAERDVDSPKSSVENLVNSQEKFDEYLHLVQVTTPFSPDTHTEHFQSKQSPMTPREMFFADLMSGAKSNTKFTYEPSNNRNSLYYPRQSVITDEERKRRATLGPGHKMALQDWADVEQLQGNDKPTGDAVESGDCCAQLKDVPKQILLREEDDQNLPQLERKDMLPRDVDRKPKVIKSHEKPSTSSSLSDHEYFIANVASKPRITSEAYIAVTEYDVEPNEMAQEWSLDTKKRRLKSGNSDQSDSVF